MPDHFDPNQPVKPLPGGQPHPPIELAPPLFSQGNASQPGVQGDSSFPDQPGVRGLNTGAGEGVLGESEKGVGVHGRGGQLAGLFDGDVKVAGGVEASGLFRGTDIEVSGDIRLQGGDCAEEFDVADGLLVEPGTVMVFDEAGLIAPSDCPYDKRAAGIVSGAGSYRPGLTLDAGQSSGERLPLALIGKAYCRVDATRVPIETGDLLTTTADGRAMKASDPARALGAVIGKALMPLAGGLGLIPVLVGLQ